jgi:hypothetical protein
MISAEDDAVRRQGSARRPSAAHCRLRFGYGPILAVAAAALAVGCSSARVTHRAGGAYSAEISIPPTSRPAFSLPTATAAPSVAKPAVIADLKGNGFNKTGNFAVPSDQWTIVYTYDCANFGRPDYFQVTVFTADGTLKQFAVQAQGAMGQDSVVEHGAGIYYLSVTSQCSWHIVITG